MGAPPFTIGVATRPFPGETVSGDAWRVDWDNSICRIAVVDGLGHGPQAAEAAAAAMTVLAADPGLGAVDAVHACHAALRRTRGAALLIASIDVAACRLTAVGAGNVEAQLWQNGRSHHLVTDRGIVGAVIPPLRQVELEIQPGWVLLMHSDGIQQRIDLEALIVVEQEAQGIADAALAQWGLATDDVIVVVVQPQ